jgi:hypothetical protein
MSEQKVSEQKCRRRGHPGRGAAAGGVIWFMGWLFTISFAQLVWWKIILGIVVWPLFLGWAVRGG